jgi:hypothetical protein
MHKGHGSFVFEGEAKLKYIKIASHEDECNDVRFGLN